MVHVGTNHTDLNQPIPVDSKNIGSIHDSANICALENILASPVHSPVQASPIFTHGIASDPMSPSHDSSAESVTPKLIYKPGDNPPNLVLYVPSDPDSYPILSYYSLSESSNSSDNEYYK